MEFKIARVVDSRKRDRDRDIDRDKDREMAERLWTEFLQQ